MSRLKEIPGYEGLYAADEDGNIWSLKHTSSRRRGKLKPYVNTGGYLRVNLYDAEGKVKKKYVHRLVAEAFLPNPNGLPVVNHKDANPANNKVANLEWCSQKQNLKHSQKMGNQNDIPVKAICKASGIVKEFPNLKSAGENLFGRWWALRYHHSKGSEI